ncbi:MAG TPA: Trk system potassium transporter TrkA [Planctomycetota bacterium]|nr:Trk system potassium transporter TrkA [Planctomycetota bacterium]
MKTIIVGAGVVGFEIACQLITDGHDVVIIEKNRERYKQIEKHLDCTTINESGTDIKILRQAGVQDADFFISVTESDEINMILCSIVTSEFPNCIKIARIRNLEYQNPKVVQNLGIDHVVNPEIEAVQTIINTIKHGATSDIHEFENADFQIRNIHVSEDSYFYDKTVWEIKQTLEKDFLIIGIIREGQLIIPNGSTVVEDNDLIYLIADEKTLDDIFTLEGRPKKQLKKIIIVGGNKIGQEIIYYMLKKKKQVTLIDKDPKVCKYIKEEFPNALVLTADITDETIFQEERLENYDLMITTTNNQELNILTSIYAKAIGIQRTMGLVVNSNYLKIANRLGLDAIISPKLSVIDKILRIVRKGNTKAVHSIFDGSTQIIEFLITENNKLIGKTLKEIDIPKDTLIVSRTRDNKAEIPHGNTQFQLHDIASVLVRANPESLNVVKKLFDS